MADYRQVVNICLIAALDDFFDRRLAARNAYRRKHRVFAAGVLEAQWQVAFAGLHAERERAALPCGEDVAQKRKCRRLTIEIQRFLEEQDGELFLIFQVLEQGGYFEVFRRDSSIDANEVMGQPLLQVVEKDSQILAHGKLSTSME